jgi:hypothetical protein
MNVHAGRRATSREASSIAWNVGPIMAAQWPDYDTYEAGTKATYRWSCACARRASGLTKRTVYRFPRPESADRSSP